MRMISGRWIAFFTLLVFSRAFAAGEVAPAFTFDGRLYADGTGATPLTDANVTLKIQILDPSQVCVLYEETQSGIDTTTSSGYFTIEVGSGTGATKRSSGDSGHAMAAVYSNATSPITGKMLADGTTACSAPVAAGDRRYVHVTVTPSSTGVASALSPNMPLDSVPTAVVAEQANSLQGLTPSQLVKINSSTAVLTQANLESIFSSTNYPALVALLAGTSSLYTQNGANGTVQLPSVSSPSSPNAGEIWYDSGVLKYYDGSTTKTLGTAGSGISSLTIGTGLTPTGTITTGGSTVAVDVGTTAGKIVQVQTGGKLPALDGSSLTNLASAITSGTIGGTTSISTTGSVTSGSLSTRAFTIYQASPSTIGVTLNASPSQAANYNLIFPIDAGTTGQFLKTTTSGTTGTLSWGTLSSADLSDAGSLIKSSQMPVNCSAGQTLTFTSPTGTWSCSTISVTASNFSSQTANTVLAAPNGSAGAPTFRALASADLPAGTLSGTGTTGYFPYYSASSTLASSPVFVTGNFLGIGTNSPTVGLDVSARTDAIRLPNGNATQQPGQASQPAAANGMIRYNTSTNNVEAYVNGAWVNMATSASGGGASQWLNGSGSTIYYSAGNVGIGTNAPSNPLQVTGTARATTFYADAFVDTTSGLAAVGAENVTDIKFPSATAISFETASTERMRISAAGNVGIGTASPNTSLDVFGAAHVSGSSSASYYQGFTTNWNQEIGSGGETDFVNHHGGGTNGGFAFYDTNAGTIGTELMVIRDSGSVGIGTNAPAARLDVNGTAQVKSYTANTATSGTVASLSVLPSYNQTSGTAANTDLLINRTQTAVGSGQQNLIDAQVGGVSKFRVDNTGKVYGDGSGLSNISGAITGLTTGKIPKAGSSTTLTDSVITESSGKIGIGTASPAQALTISGGGLQLDSTQSIYFDGSDPLNWRIGRATGALTKTLNTGATFDFLDSGASGSGEGFAFGQSAGSSYFELNKTTAYFKTNVGVGTASPSANLEVSATANSSPVLKITKANSGTSDQNGGSLSLLNFGPANIARQPDTLIGQVYFGASQPSSGAIQDAGAIKVAADGTQTAGSTASYMAFSTMNFTLTERMRISAGGNVGIGTNSPTVALDVGAKTDALRLPNGDATQQPGQSGVAAAANGMIRYNTSTNKVEAYINGAWVNMATSAGGASQWTTTGSDIYYTAGKVGIGTTAPSGTLDVEGGTNSSGAGVPIVLQAQGSSSGAVGGAVNLTAGAVSNFGSTAGAINLTGGSATAATNGFGGNVNITSGPGATPGTVAISGANQTGQPGGNVTINGGYSYGTSQNGGDVTVAGGSGNNGVNNNTRGGNVLIQGGAGSMGGTGNGGNIILLPGAKGGSGANGNVGIGTSSPNSVLDVNGNAQVKRYVADTSTSGTVTNFSILPNYNQTSGTAANTDLLINRTQTTVGSGAQLLIDAQVGGTSKFRVDNTGKVYGDGSGLTNISGAITGLTTGKLSKAGSSTSIVDSVISETSGNIGIGTTSPAHALTVLETTAGGIGVKGVAGVNSGNADLNLFTASNNGNWSMAANSTAGNFVVYDNINSKTPLAIEPNSTTNTLYIKSSGNLGVGTNAPNSKLDVQGGAISSGAQGTSAGQGGEHRFYELAANGTDYVGFRAPDSIAAPKIWTLPAADGTSGQVLSTNGSGMLSWSSPTGSATAAGSTSQIQFNNATAFAASANFVWDNTNNRLGIGTASPSSALDTQNATPVTGGSTASLRQTATDAASAQRATLSLRNDGTGGTNEYNLLGLSASGSVNFSVRQNGSTTFSNWIMGPTYYGGSSASGNVTLDSTSSGTKGSVFIAPSGGNVGIGTTSAASKLHVSGGGVYIDNGWLTMGNGAIQASVYDNDTYAAASGSNFQPQPSLQPFLLTNTAAGDSHPSVAQFKVTNSSGIAQIGYMGVIANTGAANYAPSLVFGRQTGAASYSESMRIDQSGNVGIGNASPTVALDVSARTDAIRLPNGNAAQQPGQSGVAAAANGMIRYNTATNQIEGYVNGAWVNLATSASGGGASQWTTTGSSDIYYNTGKVGINTTAPTYKLSVNGDGSGTPIINISNSGSGTSVTQMAFTGNAREYGIGVGQSGETTLGLANKWFLRDNTASVTRMMVDSTGNVGIGTTSPTSLLHLSGTSAGYGRIAATINNGEATGNAESEYAVNTGPNLRVGANGTATYINTYTLNAPLQFQQAGATKMVLAGSGNFGIGTTTPNATLDVNGAIVSETKTSAAGVTDINFSTGNVQVSNNSTNNAALRLCGLADGGQYSLIMRAQPNGSIPTFTVFSDASCSTSLTLDTGGASLAVPSATVIYTLVRAGSNVYLMVATGFTH